VKVVSVLSKEPFNFAIIPYHLLGVKELSENKSKISSCTNFYLPYGVVKLLKVADVGEYFMDSNLIQNREALLILPLASSPS